MVGGARKRCYIPGTKVSNRNLLDYPDEIVNEFLRIMVSQGNYGPIIRLCMVNKYLHHFITRNKELWFQYFEKWMRRPNIVRWVPNFARTYGHLVQLDFLWGNRNNPTYTLAACQVSKKIATLHNVYCCGMCGASRHETICFWSLGMRVCKFCLRENLISNRVLYAR